MSPRPDPDLVARLQKEVERSVLRARNGIRVVTGASKPRVGVTPKDVVWSRDRAELWRYRGDGPIRYDPPVVFVHSLVSRSYIMDLRPGNSTVEFLLGEGFDVYMLDWGIPDERDADNTIETYVDEYLPRAIDAVRRESGSDEVTLVGYCLGGTFAILYAAGHEDAARPQPRPAREPDRLQRDGRDGRRRARRAARSGGARRRDRQRAGRRALPRRS